MEEARVEKQTKKAMRFGVLGAAATAGMWYRGLWGLGSQL